MKLNIAIFAAIAVAVTAQASTRPSPVTTTSSTTLSTTRSTTRTTTSSSASTTRGTTTTSSSAARVPTTTSITTAQTSTTKVITTKPIATTPKMVTTTAASGTTPRLVTTTASTTPPRTTTHKTTLRITTTAKTSSRMPTTTTSHSRHHPKPTPPVGGDWHLKLTEYEAIKLEKLATEFYNFEQHMLQKYHVHYCGARDKHCEYKCSYRFGMDADEGLLSDCMSKKDDLEYHRKRQAVRDYEEELDEKYHDIHH